jgi:predicted ATPase with chaperone activity
MQKHTLVFTTGAPGSCWSMISNRLKRIMPYFDKTDETTEKIYKMPDKLNFIYNLIIIQKPCLGRDTINFLGGRAFLK